MTIDFAVGALWTLLCIGVGVVLTTLEVWPW